MQEFYPASQKPRRHKICFVFNMRFGGPIVCLIWLFLNLYASIRSFQHISPIYSYLHKYALIFQGISCLLFCPLTLYSLYCFGHNTFEKLKRSHRWTWFVVIQFLICYFVNMIVFCVQKPQFDAWCINKSRQETTSYIFSTSPNNDTLLPDSQLYFKSRDNGLSLYNCSRLWEDEVKFSIIVFLLLLAVYIHIAMCFLRYTQLRHRELEAMAYTMAETIRQNRPNNNMMTPNANTNMMRNLAPTSKPVQDDDQKSLAQLTRAVFGRWR